MSVRAESMEFPSSHQDEAEKLRPIKPAKKTKAVPKAVKGIKAWAVIGESGKFTLQDVCSTRERARYESGRWNDYSAEKQSVFEVEIRPIRPIGGKKK